MNSRIPTQNRLAPNVVAYIEQLAKQKAIEFAHEEIKKTREKIFLFDLMLFCAHNHKLYGHAKTRATNVIESICQDRDAIDEDILLKHTLEYMEKIGLSFLVEEWKKYD